MTPPDPYGAAGPNHIVNVGNTSIQWFTKDGIEQGFSSLRNFFHPVLRPVNSGNIWNPRGDELFDPKVIYDQYAERFVVVAIEQFEAATHSVDYSRFLVAVSDDSDPNGIWYYDDIMTVDEIPGVIDPTTGLAGPEVLVWADYPGLGLDQEAIYITANMFEFPTTGGGYRGNGLWILDKGLGTGGFYDGGPLDSNKFDPWATTPVSGEIGVDRGATLQPAHVFADAAGGAGTWLVAYDGHTDGLNEELVEIIRVSDPLATPPTFVYSAVNVGDIEDTSIVPMPDAPQRRAPGSFIPPVEIDGGDRRIMNAVWRNGSLYATATIYDPVGADDYLEVNQLTAHWFQFNAGAGGVSLTDQGNVGAEELGIAVHTYWPTVMVDSHANMAIGFTASGPNLYPGAYYAVRAVDDPPGTIRDSNVLAVGLDEYVLDGSGRNRWGDYTSIALDPTDEVTFWAYNMYAIANSHDDNEGRWGTRWGSFRLADVPPAPRPGPVTFSGMIFHDANDDGVRDEDERGLANWMVFIDLDGDGLRDYGEPSFQTDAAGRYEYTIEGHASFEVRVSVLPGWRSTPRQQPVDFVSFTVPTTQTLTGNDLGFIDDYFDHGDAPQQYGTLVGQQYGTLVGQQYGTLVGTASGGPRHAIRDGFGLGTTVDGEINGQPSDNAMGDDLDESGNFNVGDDEDGIVFPADLLPGTEGSVDVTISQGGNRRGLLQAWIDFNRDGDWSDPSEQIAKDLTLDENDGVPHRLTFLVPESAVAGTTYARFRYSYQRGLGTTGIALSGEVEDHAVKIVSDEVIANDDQFPVNQDSTLDDNAFDVLANDIPSSSGRENLKISGVNTSGASGTAEIDENGTPLIYTDDVIRYAPAPGAFAPDGFTYTIEDVTTGQEATATVSVIVIQSAGNRPVAVDDSYETSFSVDMDVLGNDRTGPTGDIGLSSFDVTNTFGTVQIIDDADFGEGLRYTAPAGFSGTDQFQYTIVDSLNVTDSATVTIHVSPHTADDLVRFRLQATDMNGLPITNGPSGRPEIGQGLEFQVQVLVEDLRGDLGHPPLVPLDSGDQGVFSAYMDLLYDASLVSYGGDSKLDFNDSPTGPSFNSGQFVDSSVPGVLDEIGAFQSQSLQRSSDEVLLFSATYTANAMGTAVFRTDPADNIPLHETALIEPEDAPPVAGHREIEFGDLSIEIIDSPDQVEVELKATPLDRVTPLTDNRILAGNDFYVYAYVEDVRDNVSLDDQGVFSAYLDVLYNNKLARPVISASNPFGFDIEFGQLFTDGQKAELITSNQISDQDFLNEVGAFQGGSATNFADEELLFRVRYTALTPPRGMDTLVFDAEPANFLPRNETTLIKRGTEEPGELDHGVSVPPARIAYIDTPPITVIATGGEGEFTNPYNAMDVNDDGDASPMDVLILVNFLNQTGTTDLTRFAGGSGEGESSDDRYYYDVNGDMVISPMDVLGLVNHLNAGASQGAGGEGESDSELIDAVDTAPVIVSAGDERAVAELTALQSGEPSIPAKVNDVERPALFANADEDAGRYDAFDSEAGDSEAGDELAELELVLSDELAEDIHSAWSDPESAGDLLGSLL